MKRITLAGLALALCFGGLAPSAQAKEVWVPVIKGSQFGYLCEAYAPTRPVWGAGGCASSTVKLNPDLSPRKLKPGSWIRMDLTDQEVARLEQSLGIILPSSAEPIASEPPYAQRPGVANENLQSITPQNIPPAPADPELMRRLDALLVQMEKDPPPAQVDPTLLYMLGIGTVGGFLLLAMLFLFGSRSQSRRMDENFKKYGDAFVRPIQLNPGERRELAEKVGAILARDEAEETRLSGELEQKNTALEAALLREKELGEQLAKEIEEAKAAREEASKKAHELELKEQERADAELALKTARDDASTTKAELAQREQALARVTAQEEKLKKGLTEANERADKEALDAKRAREALEKVSGAVHRATDVADRELEKT